MVFVINKLRTWPHALLLEAGRKSVATMALGSEPVHAPRRSVTASVILITGDLRNRKALAWLDMSRRGR